MQADSGILERHVRRLAEEIGPRLAGSAEEATTAEYVAQVFSATGATVSVETFPVGSRRINSQSLAVEQNGRWREIPCSVLGGSCGTGGTPLEAPIAIVEPPSLRRASYDEFSGRAVMLLGTHLEDPRQYERIIAARPAFIIMVDARYPSEDLRADGLFPAYVRRYGVVPSVAIPYMTAWDLHDPQHAVGRARLCVSGDTVPARSQNVIAELPGATDSGPVVLVTGHHDTQADSPGADDNATGVAAVLEIARLIAPLPRRRTVRLISFGSEEQLSVGSAAYVRVHHAELERRGGYVCNFDSIGSRMGWFSVSACLDSADADWLRRYLDERGQFAEIATGVSPYQDAFPFHAVGIPGHWVYRRNCTAGRFFHHRNDDDMSKIDARIMAGMVSAHASMIADFAQAEQFPLPLKVPSGLRAEVDRYWEECFGGWE